MELIEFPNEIKLILNFLDEDRCRGIIQFADDLGYEDAPINTLDGSEIFTEVRNNNRVMFDDYDMAAELFEKVGEFLPPRVEGWSLHAVNERFRVYRYEREQYFKWHRDGSFMRTPTEISVYTFMIYLNDAFSGGATDFEAVAINPVKGSALLFPHFLMHQGSPVEEGIKYVLRSDVMYKL